MADRVAPDPRQGIGRHALALGLIVLGARFFALWYAGSPLPYYDQWMLEFHNTLLKVQHGAGVLGTLFLRHNEHIMVTEKLLTFVGFTLNGYWDVYFIAAAAALVRAAEAGWLFHLLASGRDRRTAVALWVAALVVFAGPTSGFNSLCGMQITFYLVDVCFIAALACALDERELAGPGMLGATALGIISMGSGLSIPIATAAVGLLRRRRTAFWFWWSLSAVLAVWYLASVPQAAGSVRADVGAWHRVTFALKLMGWPVAGAWFGALVAACIVIGAFFALRGRSSHTRAAAAVIGVIVFALANVATLAANRAPEEFHQRHWELVGLMSFAVVAFAAWVVADTNLRRVGTATVSAVTAVYVGGFCVHVWPKSVDYLRQARAHRAEAVAYYQHLFTSAALLDNATGADRTLDRAGDRFYDDPILRFSPHRAILTTIARDRLTALALLSPDIQPVRPPSLVSVLTRQVIRFGWVAAVAGVVVLAWTRRTVPRLRLDVGRDR
jgi:hypothetical protein